MNRFTIVAVLAIMVLVILLAACGVDGQITDTPT